MNGNGSSIATIVLSMSHFEQFDTPLLPIPVSYTHLDVYKRQLWFHAKDIPGSHVIITGNLNPSDEVKTDAAELAAYYSKARLSNLVQVDMIEAKKLNKPTGGKPGFVTYTGQKTLRVTPEEEKIKAMKLTD